MQTGCEAILHNPISPCCHAAWVCRDLWPHKHLLRAYVEDKSAVRDLCALVLLIRRIRTSYKSGSVMRISVSGRITAPVWRRIFFLSICFGDCRRFHYRVTNARVDTLRTKRSAEHKQTNG